MDGPKYLLERLRNDARWIISSSENESRVQHPGLKGRFRELLVNKFLEPWLPPSVFCGTGMIISNDEIQRDYSQDDVLLIDKSISPPVLVSNDASEGLFLFNSVLARIEVKSQLTKRDIEKFIDSSVEVSKMKFAVRNSFDTSIQLSAPFNILFAYDSDLIEGDDCQRIRKCMDEKKVNKDLISVLCIVKKGLWKIARDANSTVFWQKALLECPEDILTYFLGAISESCFLQHCKRMGRNESASIDAGVVRYLPEIDYLKVS